MHTNGMNKNSSDMKEQIREEVMKVYDQEASVDEAVDKLLVLFGVRLSLPSNDLCFNYAEKMNLSWSTDKDSGNLIYGFDRYQLKRFIQMCQGNEA